MIAIPQAGLHFDPPVFFRTDTWNGSEKGTSSVKLLYQSIKDGCIELGYDCDYAPVNKEIIVSWGGGRKFKKNNSQVEIFFEHGWLHRWGYQASKKGVNFKHDLSTRPLEEVKPKERDFVISECKKIQKYWAIKSKKTLNNISLPKKYYVCPIQSPRGLYFRDVNSEFSQVAFDKTDEAYYQLAKLTIEKTISQNFDAPIVFKQDPRDYRDYSDLLNITEHDMFISSSSGISLHEMLLSKSCIGAVGINTNALHEAMLCGKKCVVYGQMIWDEQRKFSPFPDFFDKVFFKTDFFDDKNCVAYLYKLFSNQWYASDFSNPIILDGFLKYIDELDALQIRGI